VRVCFAKSGGRVWSSLSKKRATSRGLLFPEQPHHWPPRRSGSGCSLGYRFDPFDSEAAGWRRGNSPGCVAYVGDPMASEGTPVHTNRLHCASAAVCRGRTSAAGRRLTVDDEVVVDCPECEAAGFSE
jgi:hypothetical protein